MRPYLLVLLLLLCFGNNAISQYATRGTGMLRNDIWWFDWANFPLINGATKTYNLPGNLTVALQIDNLVDADFYASRMNTWSGSMLHLLFDFDDTGVRPALFSEMSTRNPSFRLTFTVQRDGQRIPYTIIAADAEASDQHEFTTFVTSGSEWQTVQFFRNSNQTNSPVQGCGTKTVVLSETYGGATQTGQNPVLATESDGSAPLVINTAMRRVGVYGGMAVAFGILAPLDYGDLPDSYGYAYHQLQYDIINGCSFSSPLPSMQTKETLMIGAVPGDSDQEGFADDNAVGVDEDGVQAFPEYDNSGTYSVTIPVVNQTGGSAYISAWFDYNRNGSFESREQIIKEVAVSTSEVSFTWTDLPQYLEVGSIDGYAFRFRLASTRAAAISVSGYAADGEVEDYFVPSQELCSFRIAAGPDQTTCLGAPVQLNVTGASSYKWISGSALSDPDIPNPLASPTETTEYIVTAHDAQACEARDSIVVTIREAPKLNSFHQDVCLGEEIRLDVSDEPGLAYAWTEHPDIVNSTEAHPVVRPTETTTYFVSVSSSTGCESTAEVEISVKPSPNISLPEDYTVCAGENVLLENLGDPTDSYRWYSPNSLFQSNSATISISTENAIKLFLEGKYNNGCSSLDSVELSVFQQVDILPDSDLESCINKSVTLSASSAQSYNWMREDVVFGSAPELVVSPSETTTYFIVGRDNNGCNYLDSVTVSVKEPGVPNAWAADDVVCNFAATQLFAEGGVNYRWFTAESGSISNESTVEVQPTGNAFYFVEISDPVCEVSETFQLPIEVRPKPNVTLTQLTPITCKTPETSLIAEGGLTYEWSTPTYVQPRYGNSLKVQVVDITTFQVLTTDEYGCKSVDSITVVPDFSDVITDVKIPNSFTPNNDGVNDCFSIKNLPSNGVFLLEVYNRFGQRVFSADKLSGCWNGTFRNEPQPPGNYVYQLRVSGTCGTFYKKGLLLLLR